MKNIKEIEEEILAKGIVRDVNKRIKLKDTARFSSTARFCIFNISGVIFAISFSVVIKKSDFWESSLSRL